MNSLFYLHLTFQQAAGSSKAQSTSGSGSSRFGWLVQKTVGLVSKSHRQVCTSSLSTLFYSYLWSYCSNMVNHLLV
jgi:hypothetical protein